MIYQFSVFPLGVNLVGAGNVMQGMDLVYLKTKSPRPSLLKSVHI